MINEETQAPLDEKPKEIKPAKIVCSNFKVSPKYAPLLSDSFKEVIWNCAKKTLEFTILETPEFDAYKWFGEINKRMNESNKTSFSEVENDKILLTFFDENAIPKNYIEFSGLSLIDHSCYLAKSEVFKGEVLNHHITVSYTGSKLNYIINEENEFNRLFYFDTNKLVDEEWKLDSK